MTADPVSEPNGDVQPDPGLREVGNAFLPQALGDAHPDALIRAAAFAKLDEIIGTHGSTLAWAVVKDGFMFANEKILFASQAEGTSNLGKCTRY